MKKLLWLPLLFCGFLRADEAADREKIGRVIAALNQIPRPAGLFTADFDGWAALAAPGIGGGLTVVISHEPWGEARLEPRSLGTVLDSRISSGAIRFITPDVALADGALRYTGESGTSQTTPLLLIMKRDGEGWKIAAVRVLA